MRNIRPYHRSPYLMHGFAKNFFDDDFPHFFSKNYVKMPADIKEIEDEYIIEAEIPGFTKEEIDITMNSGYLIIKASREQNVDQKRHGYIRKERNVQEYDRTFRLDNIDKDRILAKYENGILSVHLPKKDKNKSTIKKIDIK